MISAASRTMLVESMVYPHSLPSLRGAKALRECAPDDRLRDGAIQLTCLCGKAGLLGFARNDGQQLGPQDHAVPRRACDGNISVPSLFQRIHRARLDRERLQMPAGETGRELAKHCTCRD